MTSRHDKAKRWRPRFSVRTVLVVVTLVCMYAACWGPTKNQGVEDVYALQGYVPQVTSQHGVVALARCPLVVEVTEYDPDDMVVFPSQVSFPREPHRYDYYFWFFGYVAQLPFEWEVKLPLWDESLRIDY